ncbi:MAG: IS607 family transposase [Desulfobacteraceae bacterium]|nr:IS607 family transposase [Desulfobacteraceae bacterium]
MKLSHYAKKLGVHYKTAWRWYKEGRLEGYQLPTGTIIITEEDTPEKDLKVAVYARVSSSDGRKNLEAQAERLTGYCMARGWQISRIVKEIGSGVNDSRKKLKELLRDTSVNLIVVEHKDRLTRFGFSYIETLLELQDRHIEVVNPAEDDRQDIMQDLISVIYSFSARLYGRRRAKRKTEKIIAELKESGENSEAG